jgi:hypothetical protein
MIVFAALGASQGDLARGGEGVSMSAASGLYLRLSADFDFLPPSFVPLW